MNSLPQYRKLCRFPDEDIEGTEVLINRAEVDSVGVEVQGESETLTLTNSDWHLV